MPGDSYVVLLGSLLWKRSRAIAMSLYATAQRIRAKSTGVLTKRGKTPSRKHDFVLQSCVLRSAVACQYPVAINSSPCCHRHSH